MNISPPSYNILTPLCVILLLKRETMNKKELAKLKMYQTVVKLCDDNVGIVSSVRAFEDAAGQVSANVARIEAAARIEEQKTTGKTNLKRQLKSKLCDTSADVAGALYGWASAIKNYEVMGAADYSRSAFVKMRENNLIAHTSNLHELATAHKADIASYNITQDILDTLKRLIQNIPPQCPPPALPL